MKDFTYDRSNLPGYAQFARDAIRLSKEEKIPLAQARERIARLAGFDIWHHLEADRKRAATGGPRQTAVPNALADSFSEAFYFYLEGQDFSALSELEKHPEMLDWWPGATLTWLVSRSLIDPRYEWTPPPAFASVTYEAFLDHAVELKRGVGQLLRREQWNEPRALLALKCYDALDYTEEFDSSGWSPDLDINMRQRMEEYEDGYARLEERLQDARLPNEVYYLAQHMGALLLWEAWRAAKGDSPDREDLLIRAIDKNYWIGHVQVSEWAAQLSKAGKRKWQKIHREHEHRIQEAQERLEKPEK